MALLVCSVHSRECMIHRCENCPSDDILKKRISDILEEHDDDITFNQWQTTDRCKLIMQTCPTAEYVDILFEAFHKLTAHSYLPKSYLKLIK